jgi:hypothetical protein
MSKSDGGKGSSPRPFSISEEEYARRWEAIFGREDVEKIVDDAKKYLEESKRTEKSIQGLEQRLKDNQND